MSSDSELIQRVLQGETEAFRELVERYRDAVYGFAFHLVRNFGDAQDLTQEVFLAAYQCMEGIRDHSKFAGWLRGITANLCMGHLRKRREHASFDDLSEEEREVGVDAVSRQLTPVEECEKEELSKVIQKALESLPEKHQLCVTLHFMDGMSYQEIGAFLDVPVNTVKSWMHRAKGKLRRVLQMMEQEFGKQKLTPEFTERVVAEAMERGHKYLKARRWDRAVHEFGQAVVMAPHRADTHYWLGRARAVYAYRCGKNSREQEESIDAAIDEYKKAIEADPGYGPAHAHLANLYHLHRKMVDEVIAEYEKAAELDGMDGEDEFTVYNNLGYAYRGKGMYEESLEWFARAASVNPSCSWIPWAVGIVYAMQGDTGEAIKHFTRAVEMGENPDRVERVDIPNGWLDNIRDTKEFQGFLQKHRVPRTV